MTDSPKNTNSENNVKEKKKRGRKPKPKPENVPPKEPKKRGRKPKLKIVTPEDKNKFVLPSKRGRKPKDKTIILDKNLNLDCISNVILHLPIPLEKINELDDELSFKYNPEQNNPNPFDPSAQTIGETTIKSTYKTNCIYEIIDDEKNVSNNEKNVSNNEKIFSNKKEKINNNENKMNENKINENMNNIDNKINNYNSYVDTYYNTSIELNKIKCNWCLHDCGDEIIRLPYNINNGVFNMYGNFCCPECAAAFNFNELDDEYMWERYSLLNYLYNPDILKLNVAPSRLILDIFGGPLSIYEFKNIINNNKHVNIIIPPHLLICPQLEVKKNKDNNLYIPLNINRINKYTDDLKLKRKKPINNMNTLEDCMNLKCI